MCHECWSTALSAAREAKSGLDVAMRYFNSDPGQRAPSHLRTEVAAAQGSVVEALKRLLEQQSEGQRARESDVTALEQARQALLRMSDTDAGQVRPYLDFSEGQLELARAVDDIRRLWAAEPDQHATA